MVDRPHISATQLDLACRCGEAYRRRYIEGEKIPPGIAAVKGKGFHGGAETNMRQKIETRADLPASQIIEAAVASFEDGVQSGYILSEDEQSRGASIILTEAKDSVARLAEAHATEQAKDYQPVLVEEKVRIELPGSHDLLGIIDLADDKNRVVDFKTSGKSKSQAEADVSVQLSVYAAAFQAARGETPSALQLDVLVEQKRGIRRQVIETERDGRDIAALSQRIVSLQGMINSGTYMPATPGAWWCSSKWCGYWKTCRFVNAERREKSNGDGND